MPKNVLTDLDFQSVAGVIDADEVSINTPAASPALTVRASGTTRLVVNGSGAIGINGTSFGTSGQLLSSSGASAAPVWGLKITVGTTAPSSPAVGDLWVDTN